MRLAARLFKTLRANEPGIIGGSGSERLHDYRAAQRRTRTPQQPPPFREQHIWDTSDVEHMGVDQAPLCVEEEAARPRLSAA
ncbi:MAG TPA: CHAD domain-containing protein [Gammaproteobacteria bacterium]|nr:CHAD domain-containing protein [Gammaproteobacteria bacterium]